MNVSSGTGLPGLSRTNGRSTVVVVVTISISVYKWQIYQVAKSKKIDSVARIESNRNFFQPELECSIGYQFGARCQIIGGPDSLGSLLDLELVLGEPELELSYAVAKVVNARHRDGRLLTSRRRDRLHLRAQWLNYS